MVLPDSHGIARVPRYSGTGCVGLSFRYGAVTRSGKAFQLTSPARLESRVPALQHRMNESIRFGLFPFRSPLLWESRLISFPSGTEMFHFPELASCNLCIQLQMTGHDPCRVSPFRHLRITKCLASPRSFSQLTTSFLAFRRQGIHPMLLSTCFSKKTSLFPIQLSMNILHELVELDGIEPTTPGLQSRCSPS